jgi:hypothetical protein
MSSNANRNKKPQQQRQQPQRTEQINEPMSSSTSSSASATPSISPKSLSPEKETETSSQLQKLNLNEKQSTISSFYSDTNAQSARLGLKVAERPDQGGSKGRSTVVRVNFYPIDIDYTKSAVQYDVEITCTFTRKDGTSGSFSVKREHRK